MMEQTGRIIEVMEPKSGKSSKTGNPWMIQEYVLEIPGQYPRRCMFSIYGEERIKQMNVQMGEDLTIQFDIDARQYNGRWYNDIKVYNVIRNPQNSQQNGQDTPFPPFMEPAEGGTDVLPF